MTKDTQVFLELVKGGLCIYLYGVCVGGGSCRCQNRYGGFAEGLCGDGL